MKTRLLYQHDAYIKEFTARVASLDETQRSVVLDQSAFYPGGGGQPADSGILVAGETQFPVVRIQKDREGQVWHFLGDNPAQGSAAALDEEAILPEVGTSITGVLDWERRFQLMRTHTALHILCGVVFRDYKALVTGGDMDPLKGRMDFEFESLQKELVETIEAAVNREVQAARRINVAILPRDMAFQIPDLIRTKINLLPEGISEVRTVEIEGLDLQADGGTHVSNTAEVGRIRVVDYKSKGKINKRLYIELEA